MNLNTKKNRGRVSSPLHFRIREHIEWQIKSLESVPEGEFLRHGILFSIILESCLYIDSCLADALGHLFSWHIGELNNLNVLQKRLVENARTDIDSASGVKGLSQRFELVTGKSLVQLITNNVLYSDITHLYNLRNVLAHARTHIVEVSFPFESNETFDAIGNYGSVEKYLVGRNLLVRSTKVHSSLQDLLTDKVAEWAWSTARAGIGAVSANLSRSDRQVFDMYSGLEKRS